MRDVVANSVPRIQSTQCLEVRAIMRGTANITTSLPNHLCEVQVVANWNRRLSVVGIEQVDLGGIPIVIDHIRHNGIHVVVW